MGSERTWDRIPHQAPHTQVDATLPSSDWGLSEQGAAQLEALMCHPLWNSAIHTYTSSQEKAAAVGRRASEVHGLPWSSHEELSELRRPQVGDGEYEQAVRSALDQPYRAAEGWDPVESGFNRVKSFLLQTVRQGPTPVAVVSHGLVLSAVRADLLGQPKVDFEEWRSLPFAAVAEVDLANWKILSDFTAVCR